MLDKESSLRLALLRFPPIVGVLYIHAYGATVKFAGESIGQDEPGALTDFVRVLISQGLARVAVPLFFLMAGYLFFASGQWSMALYGSKLCSRARSLLVPYLCWNGLILAIALTAQFIPPLAPYFPEGADLVAAPSLFPLLDALLGITRPPIGYHLWFLRDLLLLVGLTPLLVWLLRVLPWPFLLGMLFCWVGGWWPLRAPDSVGVLFFSVGALCGLRGHSIFKLDRFGPAALWATGPLLLVDTFFYPNPYSYILHRFGLLVILVAVLYASKLAAARPWWRELLLRAGGASFFLYVAHEPWLRVLRTLAFRLVPMDWPDTLLLLYLGIPLVLIVFLLACHKVLRWCCPLLLSVISGGR